VRWSLQSQIFVPFSLLLLAAVAITSLAAAWDAARRSDVDSAQQLKNLVQTLRGSSIPHTTAVLKQVKGLSGAEFALATPEGEVSTSTFASPLAQLPAPTNTPSVEALQRITDLPTIEQNGRRYFAASVSAAPGVGSQRLWVFYPEDRWLESRSQAVWPPLVIGASSGLLALIVSGLLAHRFAARIGKIRTQLSRLAAQQYEQVTIAPPYDELYELQSSANQLAARLQALQDEIVHTERVRLLAQIAGGLAHQLRNAVTGARMGVELHQRRCSLRDDQSLDIALRQLSLTEEQIKGLLALGARRPQEYRGGDLRQIVASIDSLVEPMCRHVQVRFTAAANLDDDVAQVHDADSLRAAILNLVLNAIEAAGAGGEVWLQVQRDGDEMVVSVIDTGPGPPPATAQSLFEPFVTSKQEGVGLGLTLAQHTARHYDGRLQWKRDEERTVFEMRWPLQRRATPDNNSGSERIALLDAAMRKE
jgi:signal transduction histidine kinase